MIRDGEVTVNGKIITRLGAHADVSRDHIKVGGKRLPAEPSKQYILVNKPVACVSTMDDPAGRFCVGDIARAVGQGLFAVGRLDYHSSGLLLLTNDGSVAQRLAHPRYEIEKVYQVKIERLPTSAELDRLREGIRLSDGMTAPARVRVQRKVGTKCWLEVVLHEGRNRQLRRMLEALGIRVEKLSRTAVGPLRLGRLASGQTRTPTRQEMARLFAAVGLTAGAKR